MKRSLILLDTEAGIRYHCEVIKSALWDEKYVTGCVSSALNKFMIEISVFICRIRNQQDYNRASENTTREVS